MKGKVDAERVLVDLDSERVFGRLRLREGLSSLRGGPGCSVVCFLDSGGFASFPYGELLIITFVTLKRKPGKP